MNPQSNVEFESVYCDKLGENVEEKELRACRLCLSTKRKLFDMHGNALVEEFRKLTGIQVSLTDGFPQHVCAMCGTWIKKSAAFQTLAWRTQHFLQEIRGKNPVITTQLLRKTDRTSLELPFSNTNPLIIECTPNSDSENDIAAVDTLNNKNKDEIKEEIQIETSTSEHDNDLDSNIDEDKEYTSIEYLDSDFIANSQDGEEIKMDINNEVNVDDTEADPLSNFKKNNKLETNVTRKVKKKTSETIKCKHESNDVGNIDLKDKEADVVVPKPKRMYNSKTKEEFESFAKMHNAEVVFLTREQQIAELQARKESKDYINSRFQCEECYRGFLKESAYKRHMAWHDPSNGSYMCDICKVRFRVRPNLLSHLRWHKMHFKCKLCNTISKRSAIAKSHFKWHEGFKYECKHCGKHFNKPSTHMNHVREVHAALACDTCGLHVQGTRGLAAHRRLHAGIFECTSCHLKFHTEEALSRHLDKKTGNGCDPGVKVCAYCGAGFLMAETLAEHMSQAHKDRIFSCEKCSATFGSDRDLGLHWSRMHKENPDAHAPAGVICELCAKSFRNETQLRYHQRIHTGEKPYACTFCPKRFRMRTDLTVHLNTHTRARLYKCQLCTKTFKNYSQRRKHILLVHKKERPHKCHLCEKTYVVPSHLKMHIESAHMKMPRSPPNPRRKRNVKTAVNNAAGPK